jgi:uncharacterized membrane protein YfcA
MIIVVFFIGLLAGILSGLLGVGGATLIIPSLVYFMKLDQKTAQGISLFLLMVPVTAFAFFNYYKAGFFNLYIGLILLFSFPIGAFLGSFLSVNYLDTSLLKKIFGFFLLLVSLQYLFSK